VRSAGNNVETFATRINASNNLRIEAGDQALYCAVRNQTDHSDTTPAVEEGTTSPLGPVIVWVEMIHWVTAWLDDWASLAKRRGSR
jgi:hypothetical protein